MAGQLSHLLEHWQHPKIAWLREKITQQAFTPALSMLPRFFTSDLLPEALTHTLSEDVSRSPWTERDLARTCLLANATKECQEHYRRRADDGEWISLLKGLGAWSNQESAQILGSMGLRSNSTDVVKAIAHRNPFPARHFDDGAWRQLVLKCIFADLGLGPVIGIEERRHQDLNAAIIAYARERHAAQRPLNPHLWRAMHAGRLVNIAASSSLNDWAARPGHQAAIAKLLAGQAVLPEDCPADQPL
jgi:hypothetical protein